MKKMKGFKGRYLKELDNSDLETYFQKLYSVCLHMKLNEPEIKIELPLVFDDHQ